MQKSKTSHSGFLSPLFRMGFGGGFWETNPFFRVFFREIDRISGSTIYLFTTLIGPLLSFVVLLLIFAEGVPRNIPVGVVDLDQSALSRKIALWVDAAPETKIVRKTPNQEEAYRLMASGELKAIIVIPEGTEKTIMKGGSQDIQVFVNNTNILKGGYLQKGIYKSIATLSGGIKLQMAMKSGLPGRAALAKVQPVKLNQHILFNPYGNYSYFLLTALLPLMLVIFTLLSNVFAIGIEVREGTGNQWLESAHGSIIIALAGKFLPYTVLFAIDAIVMNVILFVKMGTPLQGSYALILLGEMGLIFTYQMMAVLLVAITANVRLALSLASAYAMMALTFSGLTFPQFAMPESAQIFSLLFPFTHWVKIFISQAIRGEALIRTIVPMATFLLFILLAWSSFPRLKRLMQEEKYWGRV